MKRTMSILGALALAVGFFMSAPATNAQTIFCAPVSQTGNTNYPYLNGTVGYAQQCGTADGTHAGGMAAAIYNLKVTAPSLYNNLANAHATFYIFNTGAEYDSYMTAHGIAHTPSSQLTGALGTTYFGTGTTPQYTVLFEYTVGAPPPSPPNGYMDNTAPVDTITVHEAGHWADSFYAALTNNAGGLATASRIYTDLLNQDWSNFNAQTNCGIGGVFNGSEDTLYKVYICSGQSHNQSPLDSHYTGSNNQTILAVGWNYYFGSAHQNETWAGETENVLGKSDNGPQGVTKFFGNSQFGCSQLLINKLIKNGALPTISQLKAVTKPGGASANCPTSGTGWPPLNP